MADCAIRINPKFAKAIADKALFDHPFQKSYQLSINALGQLIEKDPHNAELYEYRARLEKKADRKADAIKDLSAAIEIEPRESLFTDRGELNTDLKRYDEAIKDYTEGMKLNARYEYSVADLQTRRALIYVAQKKYSNALKELTEVMSRGEKKSGSADDYVLRALVHEQAGDLESAKTDYKNALAVASKEDFVINAFSYKKLGMTSKYNSSVSKLSGGADDVLKSVKTRLFYKRVPIALNW